MANLDHDDLAVAHRLAVQIAVLESNPDVGFVGGWMRFIDEDGQILFTYEHALTHTLGPNCAESAAHRRIEKRGTVL